MRCKIFLLTVGIASLFLTSSVVAQDATEWKTIQEFSGSTPTTTRPFTVSSDEWRAKWSCRRKNSQIYGVLFQAQLKQPGQDWRGETLVNALLQGQSRSSNTTYQYQSGRYYLDVVASNVRWSLEIQVPK